MAKKKIRAARRPSTAAKTPDVAPAAKTPKAFVLVKPKSQADGLLITRKSSV